MSDITQNAAGLRLPRFEPALPTLDEYLSAYSQQPVEVVNGEFVPMHPPGLQEVLIGHIL